MIIFRKTRTQRAGLFSVNGIVGMYFLVGDNGTSLHLEKASTGELVTIQKPLNETPVKPKRPIRHHNDPIKTTDIPFTEKKYTSPDFKGHVIVRTYSDGKTETTPFPSH